MSEDRIWRSVKRLAADRVRAWHKRPLRQRPPMGIGEFLEAAGLPDTPETRAKVGAVRRALGRVYGLPGEALRPEDRLADLRQLTGRECDLFEVVALAESELGRLPGSASLSGASRPESVGEAAAAALQALDAG